MLFSEKYKSKIFGGNGEWVDTISNDVTYQCKKWLVETMVEFDEPKKIKKSRYSTDTVECGTLYLILAKYCHDFGRLMFENFIYGYGSEYNVEQISAIYTPFLFDLIEMQYANLSKKERDNFKLKVNSVFDQFESPWLLADGQMIKIDSCQFEMDLKNKTNAMMLKLKDCDSSFQPAYDELMKSIEQYEKGEFPESIINACKSYESVLKVFLNAEKGNASILTESFSKSVVSGMNANSKGFADKVLMSLPYIRNNIAAHGSGSTEIGISKEMANLSINLACSLITFVVSEYARKEAKAK